MRPNKIIKISGIAFGLLFSLLLIASIIGLSLDFSSSDKALIKSFSQDSIPLQIGQIEYKSHKIRYLYLQNNIASAPLMLMIHGAPGSATAFEPYLKDKKLRQEYHLLAYDRPGYGIYDSDNPMTTLTDQSEALSTLVSKFHIPGQQIYFFSHSYGGPIAALAAIKLDSLVNAHIMVAPVISAASEKIFWYSRIPLLFPFKFISSGANKSASYEKLNHPEELAKHVDDWMKSKCLTVHIHGDIDGLAPIENIDFARKHFPNGLFEEVVFKNKGHMILWTQKDKIMPHLLDKPVIQ